MDQNELANSSAPGSDEIRQMQMLVVLFSCLSPGSKLREVLEYALALPNESCLSQITPVNDISIKGLKPWLEALWVHRELTLEEQRLVSWQRSVENIAEVVRELKEVEQKLGFKLSVSPSIVSRKERLAITTFQ